MMDLSGDAAVFLADFGEAITYTPQGATALARTAIVERSPIKPTQHGGRQAAQGSIELWIANDAVLGVASIKPRFDTCSVPEQLGGTAKTYTVTKILDQDAGMWHLECGA